MVSQTQPTQAKSNDKERANLAVVAEVSTSYVSGHEKLSAINDGVTPTSSHDTSHGAYGNWPQHGTQWVDYTWARPMSINGIAVYWYDDHRGVRVPKAARLKYLKGQDWVEVTAGAGQTLGLKAGQFNEFNFPEIETTKLRLEMDGDGDFSTGAIEWKAFDSGKSPAYPPVIEKGIDRVVAIGGKTYLQGVLRRGEKAKPDEVVDWSKVSGPGAVTFENAASIETSATFSMPGQYALKLTIHTGGMQASTLVNVRVIDEEPVAGLSEIPAETYAITSPFWKPRVKALIVNWIPHCIAENEKPDLKEGGLNNIIEAGKKLAGKPYKQHIGYPFANAWVLNTVEAMCTALMVDPDGDADIAAAQTAMRAKLDEWIPIILAAQEPDGYFQTRFTLGTRLDGARAPRRWDPRLRGEHEGYVGGYFIEAGIANYVATGGKDLRLYNAAKKLADCWYDHIGPSPKQPWYDGHEEMEQALFRLSRFVDQVEGGDKGAKYAELAKFLLDCRGQYGGGEYDQTHVPVTRQYTAVGHAVRAVYLYSAMVDVAKLTGDLDYQSAVDSLWDNLVNKKYYVTGGIGSGETSEGFGSEYSLPNDAYCESCSGAGLLFFQHKMNLLYGDAKYADAYEETLYNALLSDVDLEGQNFTYTNALDTSESRYKWHVCPCCVGNIPRVLLNLPNWTYVRATDGLNVNLFIGSRMTVKDVAGAGDVKLVQTTNYPWDGKISLIVTPVSGEKEFVIRMRIPGREVSALYKSSPDVAGLMSLQVNGEAIQPTLDRGYAVIKRNWKAGDVIQLTLPMELQRVHAAPEVAADRGRVALKYGPLIFNIESVDQNVDNVLDPAEDLKVQWSPDLLDGVMAVHGTFADGSPLLAIPYYARNNRGGRSLVWIHEK